MIDARILAVAIVEDDAELREMFTSLVAEAPAMTCVGAFDSGEQALSHLPAAEPNVVLMDIGLPGVSGIDCVRRLKTAHPAIQFVMLTAFEDNDSVFESLQAGATGYVVKRATPEEIVGAIHDVASGGAPMSAAIARKVVQHFTTRRPAPELARLSDRERAVLAALSEGQRYKEVADSLGISMNTVRTHIKAIYDKLQVNSRAEAVRKLGRA